MNFNTPSSNTYRPHILQMGETGAEMSSQGHPASLMDTRILTLLYIYWQAYNTVKLDETFKNFGILFALLDDYPHGI